MKWIYAMYPPRENLPRAELAPGVEFTHRSQIPSAEVLSGRDPEYDPRGNGPTLCNYGWGFTHDFVEKYATRHNLEVWLTGELEEIAGTDSIKFNDIPEDSLLRTRDDYFRYLCMSAGEEVVEDIEKKLELKFSLDYGVPFCHEYIGMVALYTNYNIQRRHWIIDRLAGSVKKAIKILNKIMAEPGEEEKRPMWYYDAVEIPIVRLSCPDSRRLSTHSAFSGSASHASMS